MQTFKLLNSEKVNAINHKNIIFIICTIIPEIINYLALTIPLLIKLYDENVNTTLKVNVEIGSFI